MAQADQTIVAEIANTSPITKMTSKLHGREFYRSIGAPRFIVAPMVDRSEFTWRMLTRSYLDAETSKQLLAYSPMLHARLFSEKPQFRDNHFQPSKSSLETTELPSDFKPFLDGNPSIDRPLFVQFCANNPDQLLASAKYVAPYCDAVDLNLGCPQGIARSGGYGAFLQEDWDTIHSLINTLHKELPIPVTAKMRILDTKEKTLEYAKMILNAGASILTVHGRRREQKGHNTGLADWEMIRFLRDNLPPETVLFANGNILNGGDLDDCLEATGADGIMSAEGNLADPTIFAKPPSDSGSREYWRSPDGSVGGYRLDGVFRRYLDITYKYVLEKDPPVRKPLWIPGDPIPDSDSLSNGHLSEDAEEPPKKKRKKDRGVYSSPNIRVMQGHLFDLLKPIFMVNTKIRDALAKTRAGDWTGLEKLLAMVEEDTRKGLQEEADAYAQKQKGTPNEEKQDLKEEEMAFSQKTAAKYRRPWWVAQPNIRPLPEEAIANGAMKVKKSKIKEAEEDDKLEKFESAKIESPIQRSDEVNQAQQNTVSNDKPEDLPKSALVCG